MDRSAPIAPPPLRGVDAVARLHQARTPDFRNPHKSIGPDDAIFVWNKPMQRPRWMSLWRWVRVPEQITVRVIRSRIERRGFRTESVSIVTTLLDSEKYPASEIAEVYLRRWRIELSFRDIKTTREMEHLRAQSPEIATKELLAALIAYNMVRITMIEASRRHRTDLDRLSFKGTVDGLRQYLPPHGPGQVADGPAATRTGIAPGGGQGSGATETREKGTESRQTATKAVGLPDQTTARLPRHTTPKSPEIREFRRPSLTNHPLSKRHSDQSHTFTFIPAFPRPPVRWLVSSKGPAATSLTPHRPHPHFMDHAAVEFAQHQGQRVGARAPVPACGMPTRPARRGCPRPDASDAPA